MKAQAAFVWSDGAVHLHAEAAVHLQLAFVIDPRHAEHDDALRLEKSLEQLFLFILWMCLEHGDY